MGDRSLEWDDLDLREDVRDEESGSVWIKHDKMEQ